jgi:hypothetical protein
VIQEPVMAYLSIEYSQVYYKAIKMS